MTTYWLKASKDNVEGLITLGFSLSFYCHSVTDSDFNIGDRTLKIVNSRVYLIPCVEDEYNKQITLDQAASLMLFINIGLKLDDLDKAMEYLIDSTPH